MAHQAEVQVRANALSSQAELGKNQVRAVILTQLELSRASLMYYLHLSLVFIALSILYLLPILKLWPNNRDGSSPKKTSSGRACALKVKLEPGPSLGPFEKVKPEP